MRRAAAAGLVAFALAALLWRARPDRPPARSLEVAGRFWRADTRTRLYNSPLLAPDRVLARALLEADGAIPLAKDVRVCVPVATEEARRRAAFVLAPRRVHLAGGCAAPLVEALP